MGHKGDFSHCHIFSHTHFPFKNISKHVKVFVVSVTMNIVYISNKGTVS